ncbi:hypothetical protein [Massilia phyllosphaerae]|uniref:hypothetical protein n=1 Tax=Massilia phyllosphaerae TaxID=3106034 RepID=UPI002B1CB332|nr:hypothetical protein [Massilia sp. SGZ-792]
MSALDRLLLACILAAAALVAGVFGLRHYGDERYTAGQAAAVAAGEEARDSQAAANLAIESGLRTRLLEQDATALRKEQEYASNLEAAQRRVRAGVDSLHCPAASPVPTSTAAGDRPAPAGIEVDPAGPGLMPEAAADLLGVAADVAGLVRRYERVVERFEACRAVNAAP